MKEEDFEKLLNWAGDHHCVDNDKLHKDDEDIEGDIALAKGQTIAWCGSESLCCCEGADVKNMRLWIACKNENRYPVQVTFVAQPTRALAQFAIGSEWRGAFPVRPLSDTGPGIDTAKDPQTLLASSHQQYEYEVFEIDGGIQPSTRMIGDTYGLPSPFLLHVQLDLEYAHSL